MTDSDTRTATKDLETDDLISCKHCERVLMKLMSCTSQIKLHLLYLKSIAVLDAICLICLKPNLHFC